MRGLAVLFAVLLGACAFDASGQEMAEVTEPDGGTGVVDPGDPTSFDAAPTPPDDPTPPPPPDDDDDDDDGGGPGSGHGPGHGGGGD